MLQVVISLPRVVHFFQSLQPSFGAGFLACAEKEGVEVSTGLVPIDAIAVGVVVFDVGHVVDEVLRGDGFREVHGLSVNGKVALEAGVRPAFSPVSRAMPIKRELMLASGHELLARDQLFPQEELSAVAAGVPGTVVPVGDNLVAVEVVEPVPAAMAAEETLKKGEHLKRNHGKCGFAMRAALFLATASWTGAIDAIHLVPVDDPSALAFFYVTH